MVGARALGRYLLQRRGTAVQVCPFKLRRPFEREMTLFFDVLRRHNSEFGYRVVHESSRFLNFYQSLCGYSGNDDTWFPRAFDALIIQKFLPKLHGSRAKLEGLLWALAWACGKQPVDGTVAV